MLINWLTGADQAADTLYHSKNNSEGLREYIYSSLVAQTVKCLPIMQETRVQSLGWEDLLEKAMAPHSSILAWKILWIEEPGRQQSLGSQRVGHD